jgi:hypothetical protein
MRTNWRQLRGHPAIKCRPWAVRSKSCAGRAREFPNLRWTTKATAKNWSITSGNSSFFSLCHLSWYFYHFRGFVLSSSFFAEGDASDLSGSDT